MGIFDEYRPPPTFEGMARGILLRLSWETLYLRIPGVPGSSKKKGQEGTFEVTKVGYAPKESEHLQDPSFKYSVWCEADSVDFKVLYMAKYDERIFPGTVNYVDQAGRVTALFFMGDAKIADFGTFGSGGSHPFPGIRIQFDTRSLHVTLPKRL